MSSIGEKLRLKRKERGLGLREVAKSVGISFTHLGSVERGECPNPSIQILKNLAGYYGVPLDYLSDKNGDINYNNQPIRVSSLDETISYIKLHLKTINTHKNDPKSPIKTKILNGKIDNEIFNLVLTDKLVLLKSNNFKGSLVSIADDILGKPIAFFETIQENLYQSENIYITLWCIDLCSANEVFLKVVFQINNVSTINYQILDAEIEKMYKNYLGFATQLSEEDSLFGQPQNI